LTASDVRAGMPFRLCPNVTCRGGGAFHPLNSLYQHTKGIFLAGNRSRQQRRPGAPSAQEKDAARRRISRDEAQKILREAIRKDNAGTGWSDPPRPQTCSQESATRRAYPRYARKEGATRQTDRTRPIFGRGRNSASAMKQRHDGAQARAVSRGVPPVMLLCVGKFPADLSVASS